MKVDKTDLEILKLLQNDANIAVKEIASLLNLSTTPIYERIKKLERESYITNYVALIDPKKVGLKIAAFCAVNLEKHDATFLQQFENDVKDLPEIKECYNIGGNYDYLLKIVVKDMDTYQHFVIRTLAGLKNIGKVQSSFILADIKYSTAYAF